MYNFVNFKMEDIPFSLKTQASDFTMIDPYNRCNTIEGHMCRSSNDSYGSLFISKVNDKSAPQVIHCTPKIEYPYDKDGGIGFIPSVEVVEIYEKLDGTNILQFLYLDGDGNEFITYKTRQTPMIDMGKEDSYSPLLREMIDYYPELPELRHKNGMNISLELYGMKNPHSVQYTTPLDIKVLFGRGDAGQVIPPSVMDVGSVGHATLIASVNGTSDLAAKYNEIKEWMEKQTQVKEISELEIEIRGLEGTVWYAISPHIIKMYKCKPKTVETFHFKMGRGIPAYSIMATVINAFEETDSPTFGRVVELLKEEFKEEDIYRKSGQIKRMIDDQKMQKTFAAKIIEEYRTINEKNSSFDINEDKGMVMRHMAGKMPEWGIDNRLASKVYTTLKAYFGVKI